MENLLDKIKNSLLRNGFDEAVLEWNHCTSSSATGSELLLQCGALLLWYKEHSPEVYTIVEADAKAFVKYCHSVGLYPKAYKETI